MAHLTLELGGSVVVPFGAPRGATRQRQRTVNVRRLRWKALREAAAAEGVEGVFCAISLRQAQALRLIFLQLADTTREEVRE